MFRELFNITYGTDSYKPSHWRFYPPGLRGIYSYGESRGLPPSWSGKIVPFGLQHDLKQYLVGQIMGMSDVEVARDLWTAHFGRDDIFNYEGWVSLMRRHRGYMPLRIKAVLEGTVISPSNVLMTVENTDDEFPWLPNWCEGLLSHPWYGAAVCSNSREMRMMVLDALERSGDPALIDYKVHDFGWRGVTTAEQAAVGGAAHLVNFKGTDTFIACVMLMKLYGAKEMPGNSIPAGEHSTICSWGREHELDALRHAIRQFPTGFLAQPIDTYDMEHCIKQYLCKDLKDEIMARNGTFVARPDSGHPPEVDLNALNWLGEGYGYTVNSKGYKVLPPQIRIIQGDKIDREMLGEVMEHLMKHKWSIDNITFGSGGGLLQRFDRDTLQYAIKNSYARGDTWERDVFKSPKTMSSKVSKRGRLKLVLTPDGFLTVPADSNIGEDQLVEVFRNGEMVEDQTLDEIRARAA